MSPLSCSSRLFASQRKINFHDRNQKYKKIDFELF